MTKTRVRGVDKLRIAPSAWPALSVLAAAPFLWILVFLLLQAVVPARALEGIVTGWTVVWLLMVVTLVAVFLVRAVRDVERASRTRVAAVADALGLRHEARRRPPEVVQQAAGPGSRAVLYSILETAEDRPLTVANYAVSIPVPSLLARGTRNRTVMRGVAIAPLGRALPHLALRAVSGAPRRGLRTDGRVLGYQRLSIGALDPHFAVYCPKGYERDALYILTPDVAESLLDSFAGMDVQIVDDLLIAVAPRPFELASPDVVRRAIDALGAARRQIVKQATRYRDERAPQPAIALATPNPTIAREGRRLRLGLSDGRLAVLLVSAVLIPTLLVVLALVLGECFMMDAC